MNAIKRDTNLTLSPDLPLHTIYSKTPIYRGVWGQGNSRGKSESAVNRGFVWFTLCVFSPIWGKGNGRGISGFAVNRGAVNQGFTVQLSSFILEK